MIKQPNDAPPLLFEVEGEQAPSSGNVPSQRSTRFLWTGVGFAVLMIVGLSASSHVSLNPSHFETEAAFSPLLPVHSHGGLLQGAYQGSSRARATGFLTAVRPEKQRRTIPLARMNADERPMVTTSDQNSWVQDPNSRIQNHGIHPYQSTRGSAIERQQQREAAAAAVPAVEPAELLITGDITDMSPRAHNTLPGGDVSALSAVGGGDVIKSDVVKSTVRGSAQERQAQREAGGAVPGPTVHGGDLVPGGGVVGFGSVQSRQPTRAVAQTRNPDQSSWTQDPSSRIGHDGVFHSTRGSAQERLARREAANAGPGSAPQKLADPAPSTEPANVAKGEHCKPSATAPEALEVAGADGHPIRVWRKGPAGGKPIILLHGRTWSARPVWDLQCGEPARDGASELGTSTMDLLAAKGYQSWAPDVRGMGGTARDAQGWTTPDTTVADVKAVLDMMKAEGIEQPPLIGWSQGALIAQMVAQKYPDSISHVVLYASIYDPDLIHPAPAAGAPGLLSEEPPHVDNTWEGVMEDWTVPGLIDDEAAEAFGHTGLHWDARKVSWNALDELNVLDPTKVTIPTLVIHGAKDVYTSMDKQAALFKGIANDNKEWRVIPEADHPVHLYPKQRQQWLDTCLSFIESRK